MNTKHMHTPLYVVCTAVTMVFACASDPWYAVAAAIMWVVAFLAAVILDIYGAVDTRDHGRIG